MGLVDDRCSKRYDMHTKAPDIATIAASRSFVTVYQNDRSETRHWCSKNHLTDITPLRYTNVDIACPDECIDAMNKIAPSKPRNDSQVHHITTDAVDWYKYH